MPIIIICVPAAFNASVHVELYLHKIASMRWNRQQIFTSQYVSFQNQWHYQYVNHATLVRSARINLTRNTL